MSSRAVEPELDGRAVGILFVGLEDETLDEHGAGSAVDGRQPAGGAVQADLADLVLILDSHQAGLGVGLEGGIVGCAEDHRVAVGETAVGIQRAECLHEAVVAGVLAAAAVQLRMGPNAPASRAGVDVLHGCLETDARRAIENAQHA